MLTVADIRAAIANLPDDAKVVPDWEETPDDTMPCVQLNRFVAVGGVLMVKVSVIALEDLPHDDDPPPPPRIAAPSAASS